MTTRWPAPRQNLRSPTDITAAGLAFTIAVSGADIFLDVVYGRPGSLAGVWLVFTMGTGACFLVWFSRARANTATYGPGRIRRYRDWTLAGWVCPVAGFWVPFVISAEILRASARPTSGTADGHHAGTGVTVLRAWWALWLGTWLAWWCSGVDYMIGNDSGSGVTTWQRLLSTAFDLLSIGAAGCAIAVITIVTRLQARRATELAFFPDTGPRGVGKWPLFLFTGIPLAPVMLVILYGIASMGWVLSPAALTPTRSEIIGTWRASDGGTLVFYPNGLFSGSRLSVDPLTGTVSTPWSGTGDWTISAGACDGSAPGVCLSTDPPVSSEDAWTEGSPASLTMVLPASYPGQTYDTGYNYDFSKL